VIDNFSPKILAWRVTDRFAVATTVAISCEAVRGALNGEDTPSLVADAGVENVNTGVDGLIDSGWVCRVLALRDVTFSNSMIEAWWRTLKHQWLHLNTLDSVETVRRLVEFYIASHNSEIPHSAFRGPTPDEMYYGRSQKIPEALEFARRQAWVVRFQANKARSCRLCWSQARPREEAMTMA
jgi:hypothetical protein